MNRYRVLVIDDESVVATVLARQIGLLGCDVQSAASAEDGIEVVKQQVFDLILMDVSLPGMTGFQALMSVTAISQAPVFLMSGRADDEFSCDALLLGATGFLSKPIDMVTLETLVRGLRSIRSQGRLPASFAADLPVWSTASSDFPVEVDAASRWIGTCIKSGWRIDVLERALESCEAESKPVHRQQQGIK